MGALVRFSTEAFAAHERVEHWSEHWRSAVELQIGGCSDIPFEGMCETRNIAPLRVCHIRASRHEAHRTPSLIGRADHDLLKLVFQLGGEMLLSQRGEQTILRPGQWTIYDMSQPYRLSNDGQTEQIALLVPRAAFAGLADAVRLLGARPFAASTGVSRLVQRCVQSVMEDLDDQDATLDSDIGATMIDLLRLMLKERLGTRERTSMQETMQARVRNFIRRNLDDPELSLDGIAQAMHCTKRYLHKVFSEDQTISEYIWTQRLHRCGEELAMPTNSRRSVTDIAFANGFSNSAHFSRVFKAHYGVPPRDYRCAHMSGASPDAGSGTEPYAPPQRGGRSSIARAPRAA